MNPIVFSAGPQMSNPNEVLDKSIISNQVGDIQNSISKRIDDDSIQL